jgi:hypothetical protein
LKLLKTDGLAGPHRRPRARSAASGWGTAGSAGGGIIMDGGDTISGGESLGAVGAIWASTATVALNTVAANTMPVRRNIALPQN